MFKVKLFTVIKQDRKVKSGPNLDRLAIIFKWLFGYLNSNQSQFSIKTGVKLSYF